MDIFQLIRLDHQKAKEVIAQIDALPEERHADRLDLFSLFKEDLLAHNESEEDAFYFALRQFGETYADAKHAERDHHGINDLLDELDDDDLEPAEWVEIFGEMVEPLLRHFLHEETLIFEAARKVLSDAGAGALGLEMELLKAQKKVLLKEAV